MPTSRPVSPNASADALSEVIGRIPYRMALAGGWIDQPFASRLNPAPPGAMVVVGLQPTMRFMERCGMGTSTRRIAQSLWGQGLPERPALALVRELYEAENAGKPEPSGSQDMAGLILPGITRLDYDASVEGGYFPSALHNCCDAPIAEWLERVLHFVPINQRPNGYNPLGIKNLDPAWIERLGQSGKDCYQAILARDLAGLGASFNECMRCWETILPHTVSHPTLTLDLKAILSAYQARYAGAMYSGCGGGYLFVLSEEPVPGSFQVSIRLN